MNGGEVPTVEDVSAAADKQLLELYSDVMAELMVRGREEHRDHWGPEEGVPGPLVAVDHEVLLGVYRAVHDEMMVRQAKSPGLWGPRDHEDLGS